MKSLRTKICLVLLLTSIYAVNSVASNNEDDSPTVVTLDLTCSKIEKGNNNEGIHRSPVVAPIVYYNYETKALLFNNACYNYIIQLVQPSTESIIYSIELYNGENVIQLPTNLSGQYELRIIRGNYCFWGIIEL